MVKNNALPFWLENFINIYTKLNKSTLGTISELYHDDIFFKDPMHQVQGVASLLEYFMDLYTNINSCDFVIEHYLVQGDQAAIYWSMTFSHTKLNKGKDITINGNSLIKQQDGKIIYHQDYFDSAAMLYEHIPLLGSCIRFIKNKAASS